MLELPKSVKIGPTTYEIRIVNRLFAHGMYGQLVRTEGIIEILPDLPLVTQWATLLHEAEHEWQTQAGIANEDQEERLIVANSYGCLAFLIDNDLMK